MPISLFKSNLSKTRHISHKILQSIYLSIVVDKFKNYFSEKKKHPLIENLKIKSLISFKHQINIIVVILSHGIFLYW